jgi:predicted Zn-dependent peptidase
MRLRVPLAAALLVLTPAAARPQAAPRITTQVEQTMLRSFHLASGLAVVLARTPAVPGREPRAYVGSYVEFGLADESFPGEAHLLEHLVANSPPAIAGPASPEGMKSFQGNALTKPHHTSFLRTISPDGLAAAIHSRLARIGRVAADTAVLERQRTRVLDELTRSAGSPAYRAYVALNGRLRGQGGTLDEELDAVRRVGLAPLLAVVERAYVPERGALVVAGDIELDSTEALVREAAARLGLDRAGGRVPGKVSERTLDFSRRAATLPQNAPGIFSGAVGFLQPNPGEADFLPFLVLDQLLLGGREPEVDPHEAERSVDSPLARGLAAALRAEEVSDQREPRWGAPIYAEGDPWLYAISFRLRRQVGDGALVRRVRDVLRTIREEGMSDEQVAAARDRLAGFYDRYLMESDLRILSDHLAAAVLRGRNPAEAIRLPSAIREVTASDVRRVMDQRLLRGPAAAVVLVPRGR